MKQRFSSLDVKVIAHELSNSLVTLRLANVYDLSSKIFLLKFAKPDDKKQMILDSGFRCHLTSFSRATAAAPSLFVARLRKYLKTRRVTSVSQVGTDRIIEFQFSDGQYRLMLEFFAGGNIILTDKELNILALLRIVAEGDGQEELRVGHKYSLDNRQNYGGIPPLTKERLRQALQRAVDKGEDGLVASKKQKQKATDALRKALAVSITEFPPALVQHTLLVTQFDATLKPAAILENEDLFSHLMRALEEAQRVVQEITGSQTSKGYIIAKPRKIGSNEQETLKVEATDRQNLLYDDFHPFRPKQFEDDPSCTILPFEGFNNTVDEFYSSLEGQKLESRLHERELTAKKKLQAARDDQAKRLGGLQEAQQLNVRKASAIEANIERVQEAMDAVNGLMDSGRDWVEIEKLIELEQKRHNPVAEIIKLPLKLPETMTLLLGEVEIPDDDESADATDSDVSDSEDENRQRQTPKKATDTRLAIEISLGISPWSNAREYYDQKKVAVDKEQRTLASSSKALKSTEHKITQDLKKGLKQEKAVLRPVRQQMWFEKFIWFISSDGYLVLGGRDAQQNEILYKRYLRKGDVYVHADLHGASSIVIRNNPSTVDAPIPPSTLSQAGTFAVASSSAWDSKAGMSAWWVNADQVSKSAPTGEYLPTGSFMVRGKKNFLPPAQLLLGFGVMFRISEESKVKHLKHRLQDDRTSRGAEETELISPADLHEGQDENYSSAGNEDAEEVEESDSEEEDDARSNRGQENPLESSRSGIRDKTETQEQKSGNEDAALIKQDNESAPTDTMQQLDIQDTAGAQETDSKIDTDVEAEDSEANFDADQKTSSNQTKGSQTSKKGPAPLPRGKRSKAKKIAVKYKDQDEEDRVAAQTVIGATLGREKAEEEAKARAQREAEAAFQKERRRLQHQRTQKETAEHEEVRKMMLDEGIETIDDEEAEKMTLLDEFVGTPLPGDEILEAIPVCAPWAAMNKIKYKAKLQPGTQKKGKAVKEILERWIIASAAKGVLDTESRDAERMWPREVELLRGWKAEECINCVPVGKVRVMMAGGSSNAGGKGSQGKGRGGKGSKRQR